MLYLDADVFFFIGRLCADFLVHAAGPENLMIIFLGLRKTFQNVCWIFYPACDLHFESELKLVSEVLPVFE